MNLKKALKVSQNSLKSMYLVDNKINSQQSGHIQYMQVLTLTYFSF